MHRLRRAAAVLSVPLLVAVGTGMPGGAPANARPAWAPAATAAIHPGVQTVTGGGQCTANFIYTAGGKVYIGQAAHCSSTGGSTQTNGCTTQSLPLGTPVTVTGAGDSGTLVYNSWITMQQLHESDGDVCQYNDLALVELSAADARNVNPSVPVWGGPLGLNTAGTVAGSKVFSYGNSGLRLGLTALSPKEGISLGDAGGGWSHGVYTATPGIPGDSGSAFLDASGRALGVLSTIDLAPLVASNNMGDLNLELAYLHAHGGSVAAARLAAGTQRFNPNAVPVG
jgi:hypothetical protein